ncbi:hypothetical protein BDZ97DRAFT_1400919 [Flammula alnicola]|nr:hypothetical protein BDZ97DRAFT_1400919 [Flammula alnicola]
MLATNFANPAGLDQVDLIWFSVPMLSGIVATISQIFYAYRLKVITKNKYLVGSIMLLSLVQLGGAIALGVQNKEAGLFSRLFSNQSKQSFITTTVWEVSSALCDVLIAVYMTYHLRRQDTGIKQTQALLSRIIRLTVQTGTFTATLAIAVVVLVYLPGHPTYYQTISAILGKAYANSMLVLLNSRVRVVSSPSLSWDNVKLPTIRHGEVVTDSDTLDFVNLGYTRDESRGLHEWNLGRTNGVYPPRS